MGSKGSFRPKGGGKGGKGKGGKGKGGNRTGAPPASGGGGASGTALADVECLWCHKMGHYRRDCKALLKYKTDKDAERAKKGNHSAYVPPGRGPTRPSGCLDEWTEDVTGITGDDEDAGCLEDVEWDVEEFQDWGEAGEDDGDREGAWEAEDELCCGGCNAQVMDLSGKCGSGC